MPSSKASPKFGHANAKFFFSVYAPYKESISKEMTNDIIYICIA